MLKKHLPSLGFFQARSVARYSGPQKDRGSAVVCGRQLTHYKQAASSKAHPQSSYTTNSRASPCLLTLTLGKQSQLACLRVKKSSHKQCVPQEPRLPSFHRSIVIILQSEGPYYTRSILFFPSPTSTFPLTVTPSLMRKGKQG